MVENRKDQQVTLGCGTLILIALIVLIFGAAGDDEIKSQLSEMQRQIENLESSIHDQKTEIERLRMAIDALNKDE